MSQPSLIALAAAAAVGLLVGLLIGKARSANLIGQLTSALHAERTVAAERLALLSNDQTRAQRVESLVAPVGDALGDLQSRLDVAERSRIAAQAELAEQLRGMAEASAHLRQETGRLVHALNRSEFRGRWGEAQLRRVVEAAGLMKGVHFLEQPTVVTPDCILRPDMVITLTNSRTIVVDAKVALDALLAPQPAGTDQTEPAGFADSASARARQHAMGVANHIDQLASKEYWQQFPVSPEFVVMFLPAESLLGTALQADPGLLERAFSRNVVLATPSTLLALLRTVAMGWRDEALTTNAREIHQLGRELHSRLQVLSSHLGKVGSALDTAVVSYNKAIGSFEGRVLVSARRMADLGITAQETEAPQQVDRTTRSLIGVAATTSGES